jgi:cation diffusion facilitator CzcD-associated flavoprotein CzcO
MGEHPIEMSSGHDFERHQAIVVGAGPAGLASAAALRGRGLETVVFEGSDALGARWRSRYEELRLNSWRAMSNLQGHRMPRSVGRYPGRDDFVAYLEAYAAHHRLDIRPGTRVLRVERSEDLWRLDTATGPALARFVVIATGWDAVPVLPDWPGWVAFVPELIHSSDFRGAAAYRDREVLVVGAGNSGIDIAGHLIAAGAHVTVSMRTPPNLAKGDFLGLPGQPFLVFGSDRLPKRLADWIFALVQRRVFGDLSRFGVPPTGRGPYANFDRGFRSPAIDTGFVAALKEGRTRVVGEIERLEGPEVVLVDGGRLRPDAVICATGYRRGLEGLVGHLGVLRPDGVPLAHRGAPEHPAAPRLYFAGMWGQFSGQIRLGPIHARRIARSAAGQRTGHPDRAGSFASAPVAIVAVQR